MGAACPVPGGAEADCNVHAPFPGVKTNRRDQLSSEPMAQVRPVPRENPLLGYKLTWVRAMPVENRATPWQNGTESPGGEVKTVPGSNGKSTLTPPRPLLSVTVPSITEEEEQSRN